MNSNGPVRLRAGGHTFDFSGGRVHLMGVLNLSPESKNTPTVAATPGEALRIADEHRAAGASIIDVGAQSSHFENEELSPQEELDRFGDTVARLVDDGHAVSIDTWKPSVAAGMIEAGAVIINDTGGLTRPEMVDAVAGGGVAAVVMFLQGDSPLTVGGLDLGSSLVPAMVERLSDRLRQLDEKGVHDVVIDPGIGISYRTDRSGYTAHQIDVIRHVAGFGELGRPVLIPVPRKPDLPPTLALATLALEYGADVLRVHDVASVAAIARLMGRME